MLTSSKGRIVERLHVHVLDAGVVLLLAGRNRGSAVLDHLRRYTFAEQTGVTEAGDDHVLLAVSGPVARQALEAAGLPVPDEGRSLAHAYEGHTIHVLDHDGSGGPGFACHAPAGAAEGLWRGLTLAAGSVRGRPAGSEAQEAARILRGEPGAGHELTEEYNPLEVGLWDAVSFDKGCYVGQEVIARLRTYDKVSRLLVGLQFPADAEVPEAGAAISVGDAGTAGHVTSAVRPPGWDRPVALGLVKKRLATPGDTVQVGGSVPAKLVELPFRLG